MKNVSFLTLMIFAAVFSASTCAPQTRAAVDEDQGSFEASVEHPELRGDFVNILLAVARRYRIPIVAEVSEPLPKDVTIPSGRHNASQILNILMQAAPACSWQREGIAAHVYEKKLLAAPGNFLNYKVKKFRFPATVSDLKLMLPSVLTSVAQGTLGRGGVVTGFRSKELSADQLPPKVLQNTTGRKILLEAVNLSPHFASVIVFPSSHPKRQAQNERDYATRNWFWVSLSAPTQLPVRVE